MRREPVTAFIALGATAFALGLAALGRRVAGRDGVDEGLRRHGRVHGGRFGRRAALVALAYGAMVAVVTAVQPQPREMSYTIPAQRLNK